MLVDSPLIKLSGEPTAEALSNGLATLGRYGDTYMVHAADGETVIPKEILEANPGLKNDLFRQMTMMGIEDPNRYVVGSDLNSINPITGQPEFFFKKIFKAVKRIAKKILPIAAPILGNLIAPGIGGIIASGLVTKMQGGSWGDALKSAALSYGAGALGKGIMGGLSGTAIGDALGVSGNQTFMGGLSAGLTDPFSAAGNLFSSGAANPLAQGIFGPRGMGLAFSSLDNTAFANKGFGGGPGTINKLFPSYQGSDALTAAGVDPMTGQYAPKAMIDANPARYGLSAAKPQSWMTEVFTDPAAATAGGVPPGTELVPVEGGYQVSPTATFSAPEQAVKPGFLERNLGKTGADLVGPMIVPGAVAGLVYAMSPEEEEVADQLKDLDAANPRRAAYDQWQNLPDKNSAEASQLKAIWYGQPSYSSTQLASSFGANPLAGITAGTPGAPTGIAALSPSPNALAASGQILSTLPFTAAAGGEVFGPGTGTSDSIPARLSDGEFVMTAEAVRNAGDGNRSLGAARMYDMMNRFERGVA